MRAQERTEMALRLSEDRAAEQQRKAELVRQLRALEAVPKTAVKVWLSGRPPRGSRADRHIPPTTHHLSPFILKPKP